MLYYGPNVHNLCARVNMRRMLNNAAKLHVKYKLLMPSCGENIDNLHNLFYSNSDGSNWNKRYVRMRGLRVAQQMLGTHAPPL